MSDGGGPPPMLGLVAALVVLIAGVAAGLTKDNTTSARTTPSVVATSRTLPATTSSTTTPRPTFNTLPPSVLSTTTTSTTVRPAVPTPEAAANGLWAAYTSQNRSAAARFASPAVVDALFSSTFSGEDGAFQGCAKRQTPSTFDCEYQQGTTTYLMTAQADAAASYKIFVITITSSG